MVHNPFALPLLLSQPTSISSSQPVQQAMPEPEPNGWLDSGYDQSELITQAGLCKETGLSRAAVQNRLKATKPVLDKGRQGVYYLKSVVFPLFEDKLSDDGEDSDDYDDPELMANPQMADVKLRRAQADLAKAELAVQRMRGELMPAVEVKTTVFNAVKGLHQRLTVGVPRRLGPELAKITDERLIIEKLRAAIQEEFEDFRANAFRRKNQEVKDATSSSDSENIFEETTEMGEQLNSDIGSASDPYGSDEEPDIRLTARYNSESDSDQSVIGV